MKKTLATIAKSKKFLFVALAIAVWVIGKKTGVPTEDLTAICGALVALAGFQGMADWGKEAKKIEAGPTPDWVDKDADSD